MAEVNYQSFSLDIDKAASKNLNQVITGRLGDNLLTGVIVSTLENDKKFDLTGYSIRFEGTTHDGTIVVDADNVEIVSLKEGTFKYTFSNKVFSVLDQYQTAYFAFEKADRRATTENFIISVIEDVDVTWEEAQSYISILNALIRKFNTEWDEFKADKTKTFDDFIKTKETQYQQLSDTAKQLGIDFAELQSLVTQLQKDVSAMETKATQLSKDLTALDSKSKAVSTAFDTTKKNVDTLDVTVADLAKRSTDLKTETTNLESRVSTLKTDTTSLEQRTEDIQQVQSELAADVTEVSKAIEENDVYRKAETFNQQQDGVNVLDTITGTKPTLYSETLLADGEQGTGSIFVKDLPYGANYAIGTGTSKTLTGDGSKQATNNNLYTLSDKLLGKKVTVSVEVEKSAGATGEGVIIAIKNTWQQLFSFKVADIPAGSKKKLTTTTTIRTDDNIQALYMQSQPNNSTNHLNGTITVSNFKIELGDTATPWCPASEDYGIVHGQPNIFTGAASSSEWRTLTFGGYYHNDLAQRYIVGKDINVGDTISSSIEIDNSLENSVTYLTSQATVIKNDSSAPTYPESGTYVNVGESKTITLSYKVQSNDAEINMKLAMKNPQESTTFRYRNAQIIKGDVSLLAEGWKPAQQNSGLTPHNPKILSESRNLFSAENATLGYFQGWSYKSDLEANANRACSVKIPVTASKVYSVYSPILTGKANFIVLACYDSQDNKTHMYRTDKWIVPDATHTSSASYRPIVVTIPAGTAYVRLAVDSNG
ncbi:BppU family phage baseplate upper protein, partial [Enterococcus pallens]